MHGLTSQASNIRWQTLCQQIKRIDGCSPSIDLSKHKKMCTSPFVFYRGSSQLFYHDWHNGIIQLPSALYDLPLTTVMGDCHISNFGFLSEEGSHGDQIIFTINDFDDACIGHPLWDLQRLATSLHLAADHCQGGITGQYSCADLTEEATCVDQDHVTQALVALYSSYLDACEQSLSGISQSQRVFSGYEKGTPLHQGYKKAQKRALGGKHFLSKSTLAKAVDLNHLPLRFISPHPKFTQLSEKRKNTLREAFAPYFMDTILDVVARVDAGTGSVNMERYYFLIGPDTQDSNTAHRETHLVEVKQQRQAAPLYYFPELSAQNTLNPAHLTIMCQRRMQRRPDLVLDEVLFEDCHWLVRSRHHAKVGIDPQDICCGDSAQSNELAQGFIDYARACGEALALGHLRGDRRSIRREAKWFDAISTHQHTLMTSAQVYAKQVQSDWTLFTQHLL